MAAGSEPEPWTWNQVLDREVAELATARTKRTGHDAGEVPLDRLRDHLVGLGFSGGGIRSATFSLGVLQAFAKAGLLRHLDYLSTVSGGGYIGSWLSAWIARAGLDEVEKTLGAERDDAAAPAGRPRTAEPDPIRFLRNYSNYVTPRVGALTGDTWAVVGIYLRNLLLNLVIVIGVLGLVLTIPRIIATAWSWVAALGVHEQLHVVYRLALCALVLFVLAATNTQRSLDNFACRVDVDASVNRVYAGVTLPFLVATLLLTIGMRSAAAAYRRRRRALRRLGAGQADRLGARQDRCAGRKAFRVAGQGHGWSLRLARDRHAGLWRRGRVVAVGAGYGLDVDSA
jgi:hypothetical protein